MAFSSNVRLGWLKAMYIYTIIGAGGFGLWIILAPDQLRGTFGFPKQDPVAFGVCGSVYVAFALASILGLRSPLKFSPVLLLQLFYKLIWFVAVIAPMFARATVPRYAIIYIVLYATYIAGDLMAIPFAYVLGKEAILPKGISEPTHPTASAA